MQAFKYSKASGEADAVEKIARPNARFLAGGTLLVDLMKLGVETPGDLVDVGDLPLAEIARTDDGLSIGAMARNSDLAAHPLVTAGFPVLAQALLSGASPQLRNAATVGGNLMQRTRCSYFRDLAFACNKRKPGSGCDAMAGWSRMHAVLGTSDHCIAAHPSDMCVALVALDAVVHVRGPNGATRAVPIADFHVVPGARPDLETVLGKDELITRVVVPNSSFAARSRYVKTRDRASYAFALTSAAVALDVSGGTVKDARVALGGVATKPWRSKEAEQRLVGRAPSRDAFTAAATAAFTGAVTTKDNAFKVELGKRTIVRALELAMEAK